MLEIIDPDAPEVAAGIALEWVLAADGKTLVGAALGAKVRTCCVD